MSYSAHKGRHDTENNDIQYNDTQHGSKIIKMIAIIDTQRNIT
jgi:hypothetical protein